MNSRPGTAVTFLALLAAVTVFSVAQPAHAGLFSCDVNCQARREAKAQKKAADKLAREQAKALAQSQQQAAQGYGQPTYNTPQPGYNNGYNSGYNQAQQQQGYPQAPQQQTYGPVYQPQPQYQQPSYQAPPQYQQPQYQQPSDIQGYASYYDFNHVQQYGQLTNQDWLQFAQVPYGYVPTPIVGAVYDRTPYPVTVNEPQIQALIAGAIAKGGDIEIGPATVNAALVRQFYSLRGNQPAFVTSAGLSPAAAIAKDFFVNKSVLKGLDSRDYWSADMDARFNNPNLSPGLKAGLDLLMVQSYVRLTADLMNGRIDPKLVDTYIMIKKRPFTEFQALNNTLREGVDQAAAIESFEPQHADYKKLEEALPNLMTIKSRGGWPKIAGNQILKPGVSSPDVPLIRARLMELNILPYSATVDQSPIYDLDLATAVKEFQFDNKMKADGIIGKQGFSILNTPVEERIKEVRATLEKWRWMPRTLGNRFILVNIARQEMQVMENGQIVMAMKTVNGQVLRPTNILFDQVVSVDMNPYWNPPPSLIMKDIIPGQLADKNHLVENHVKIYRDSNYRQEIDPASVDWTLYKHNAPPFTFREEPGLDNSLGVVKFQTTNSSAIYLHDTNHREFFDQYDERYLSSGCIRLQHPLDLMQYLLRNRPEWSPQAIDEVLSQPNKYTHHVVQLGKDAIPFYVFYGTASFDERGNIRFARDAYSLDERIVRAMTPADDSL